MYLIVAVLFAMPAFAARKKDLIIHCSDDCVGKFSGQNGQGTQNESGNQFCSVSENVPTPWKTHIPGPKADIQHVNWYVEEKQPGHRQLAINITWSEKGYWVGRKLTNGYFLQIVPSGTFNVKYNVIVKAKNLFTKHKSKPRYRKVFFNYKCYGLSEDTFVSPGKTYVVVLKTLPVSPQNLDHLFDAAVVSVPEMNFQNSTTMQPPTTSGAIASMSSNNKCCQSYHLYILFGIGGLLVFVIFYLGYLLRKQSLHADLPLNKHVIILIDNQRLDKVYAKVGDELARLLNFVIKRVTYSLWHATEISQIGIIEWLSKYTSEVDCIIVICSSCCPTHVKDRKNKFGGSDIPCCSGMHSALSSLFLTNGGLKYCSIHFDTKQKHCIYGHPCFTLPKDCSPLLKKLSVTTVPEKFKQTLKQQLGYFVAEINDKDCTLLSGGNDHQDLSANLSNVEMEYVCSL